MTTALEDSVFRIAPSFILSALLAWGPDEFVWIICFSYFVSVTDVLMPDNSLYTSSVVLFFIINAFEC